MSSFMRRSGRPGNRPPVLDGCIEEICGWNTDLAGITGTSRCESYWPPVRMMCRPLLRSLLVPRHRRAGLRDFLIDVLALDVHAQRLAGAEERARRPDLDLDRDCLARRQLVLARVQLHRLPGRRLRLVERAMAHPQPAERDRPVLRDGVERERDAVPASRRAFPATRRGPCRRLSASTQSLSLACPVISVSSLKRISKCALPPASESYEACASSATRDRQRRARRRIKIAAA